MQSADLHGRTLMVHGKGGKRRMAPLSARARQALALLPHRAGHPLYPWSYRS